MTATLWSRWPHVTYRVESFDAAGYGNADEERKPAPLAESNVITSEVAAPDAMAGGHTVALDIDIPAVLVPSSTPGHSHLYIDCPPMPWAVYEELLGVLAKAGVIEPGYAGASVQRKHTSLRLPWVRKSEPATEVPF